MDAAGMDFAILSGEEWCCGFPLIGAGVPDKAKEMMDHNLKKVKALGAKRVVFSCPSCYRTWNFSMTPSKNSFDLQYTFNFIDNRIKFF